MQNPPAEQVCGVCGDEQDNGAAPAAGLRCSSAHWMCIECFRDYMRQPETFSVRVPTVIDAEVEEGRCNAGDVVCGMKSDEERHADLGGICRYQFEDVLALLSGVDDSELTRKLLQTVAWQDEDDAAGTGGGGNGSPVNMVRRMTTYLSEAMGFSCPKCLTPAIREDGCANMECQCGAHFCWACFECFGRQGHVLADPEQATYQHLLKNHGGFYPKETHVAHFHRIKRAEQLAKVLWNHRKSLRKQEEEQPGFSSLLVGEFVRLVPDYSELLPRRVAQDLGWFFACHSPSTSAQTIGVKAAARMFRIVEWKEWRETSGRGPLEAVHVGSLAHFIARYGWKDGCRFWGLSFNPTWDAFTDALKSSLRVEQWEEADK